MEGGTDEEPGLSMSGAGRTSNLVEDVLESLIGKVVEKCEEDINKSKKGKNFLSECQRVRLEQVFSKSRYLCRESKNKLAAELDVGSKQVERWFDARRRAEVKAEALRAEDARRASTTWPRYKLNIEKQVQEVSEVKEDVETVNAYSGKCLLKELEEKKMEVERRAVDMVVIRPIPIPNTTLTQQEVLYRESQDHLYVYCFKVYCVL